MCANGPGDPLPRNPITGTAACCALTVSGHAAAAPPSSVMSSRRLTSSMGSPPEPAVPAYRTLRLPWKCRQVLGLNLKRSEAGASCGTGFSYGRPNACARPTARGAGIAAVVLGPCSCWAWHIAPECLRSIVKHGARTYVQGRLASAATVHVSRIHFQDCMEPALRAHVNFVRPTRQGNFPCRTAASPTLHQRRLP
jgi:hypothetical protein